MDRPSLLDMLHLDRGIVSIIGGGGKTSLMLSLAAESAARGCPTVITTTTRIWPPEGIHLILSSQTADLPSQVVEELRGGSLLAAGRSVSSEGKLEGFGPEDVDRLGTVDAVGLIVCEADGAAGRPLKAHGPGEPVVPRTSSHVLIVAGMDGLGRSVGPDTVHRYERFLEVTGIAPGDAIGPSHVARCLAAALRFVPSRTPYTFVLNQVDDEEREKCAFEVVIELERLAPGHEVMLTRYGRLRGVSRVSSSLYSG